MFLLDLQSILINSNVYLFVEVTIALTQTIIYLVIVSNWARNNRLMLNTDEFYYFGVVMKT